MSVELYLVGGAVRDKLMGEQPHDYDFTATALSWDYLLNWLDEQGFKRFVTNPEYLTTRAHFPKGFKFAGEDVSHLTADIVMARKESGYTDGRRPDSVIPGELKDDILRRDFSCNALAMDSSGEVIDLVNGRKAINERILRCVGSAELRMREDALRAVRAIRFCVTKHFAMSYELDVIMQANWLPDLVAKIAVDRRRDELMKMFKHNTVASISELSALPWDLQEAIFSDNLWLQPTNKSRGNE